MAKSKPTRNKKFDLVKSKTRHIHAVLNSAMSKFYIMGDMNHSPMPFHISQIKSMLKGSDLKIALELMTNFLYGERKLWHFAVYHFFKVGGKIEVVPSLMRVDSALLNEVADSAEENIKLLKESILDSDEGLTEENYLFYGYYINYGADLRMDAMEEDIINVLFKVNNDLVEVNPEVSTCTAEKVLQAIAKEKFSLVNSDALSTEMVEEVL